MKKTKVISIFIPHEGCPHDCTFCNQKKISGHNLSPSEDEITETIEESLKTLDKNENMVFLAFYGGSFTAIDKKLQEKYLRIATKYKNHGFIDNIRISTRPDYLNKKRVELLAEYGVDHVELGVQSTDEHVLKKCRRYYDINTIKDAVNNLKDYDISYGFQIMLGLPGDNINKVIKTCLDLYPLNPSTLRIYPTLVIKDTDLEADYTKKLYMPLSLEDAIDYAIIPFVLFNKMSCRILRMGLHSSESLLSDGNIIAGPFHSAFGEMVISKIYFNMLDEFFSVESIVNKDITIEADDSIFSKISGNHGVNKNKLKELYNINIKFRQLPKENDDIIIKYDQRQVKLSFRDYCNQIAESYMVH